MICENCKKEIEDYEFLDINGNWVRNPHDTRDLINYDESGQQSNLFYKIRNERLLFFRRKNG